MHESPPIPSDSQRAAIEAPAGPMLVLAGPGAGKTFCLIERIRYLIEELGVQPARICAFTFTNRAAEEIGSRLQAQFGPSAGAIQGGTLHAFCVKLLREHGSAIGLQQGFGIADTEYSLRALRRIGGPSPWHTSLLTRFSNHRFRGEELNYGDPDMYLRYVEFLERRNMLDFDMLVLKTAELLRVDEVCRAVRGRWDCVLVDEFQDLNRTQYAIIRALTDEHRNVFAVGDDEQSIYSWAGADPEVFRTFVKDFGATKVQLCENWRCPREVVALGRKLMEANISLFDDREHGTSDRNSSFPVAAHSFREDTDEIAWIIRDLQDDRASHDLELGDFALLYRKNETGAAAETAFLRAGIPCRLSHGRALIDDPVVSYLIAALRVIAFPDDDLNREYFLQAVLPKGLFDDARAKAEERGKTIVQQLSQTAIELGSDHADARKIKRGFADLRNLAALAKQHVALGPLIQDLLSHRVGEYRTFLDELHDELSDPADDDQVAALADVLAAAVESKRPIWVPRLGGMEIPLKALLLRAGVTDVRFGPAPPGETGIDLSTTPATGIALGVFKAIQLGSTRGFASQFRDFATIDIETTDVHTGRAEIAQIGAVRVRDGRIVEELEALVKPTVPITPGATEVHGITDQDVAGAPPFAEIWPAFREFCGGDVVVAHNGYHFDFRVIRKMAANLGTPDLCTYDSLPLARELHQGSASLKDLAAHYGVDPGRSHSALSDARALAHVFLALRESQVARARKTAHPDMLSHLGVAIALSNPESLTEEARALRRVAAIAALGAYSDALDFYELERRAARDESVPTVEDVIALLGGQALMARLRAEKSAEDRYPDAMRRLKPLLALDNSRPLGEQIVSFIDRVSLSRYDGLEPDGSRVHLLTLHATKGLQFSRVYIVGVEDEELPGGSRKKGPTARDIEEARRLLYVGMTRTKDRLVLTRVDVRRGVPTGGKRFLDEMQLNPQPAR